jgi:hypothetical protein
MARRNAAPATRRPAADDDIPVVGGREACPCGSGKRYKACHGRSRREAAVIFSARPFEGLHAECDWVALREIVPAATATARLRDDLTETGHGGAPLTGVAITVASVLPMAWPALHRTDGSVMVGLQTTVSSGDASRDVAQALLSALAAEPGTAIAGADLDVVPGPRLQDLLDLGHPFEVDVRPGFDFWLQDDQEQSGEVADSLARANESVVPTRRLTTVDAAYWCQIGERRHLRWVLPQNEDALLDAIARLHAASATALVDGARYVGAFRADGLLVPVWDLPADCEPEDVEEPAAAFAVRLGAALEETTPLTALERRARAGVVSRQVTIR